jgi:protein-tyrosine phosphatase
MGEVILRSMLLSVGLDDRVVVDSAGTGGWHEGHAADPRTVRALKDHGYDGTHHRAREFRPEWFSERDLIVAADEGHVRDLRQWAPDAHASSRVRLLREFDPTAVRSGTLEVDDPYFGDADGFEQCLRVVERACQGLVEHLRGELADFARLAKPAEPARPAEPADSRT